MDKTAQNTENNKSCPFIQFAARIRKPNNGFAKEKSKCRLQPDFKYSIFTTGESSKTVLASDIPITGKTINSTLLTESDIQYFCSTVSKPPIQIPFDFAVDESSTQENLYSLSLKSLVKEIVKGKSATVICFGPGNAGKTYALMGKPGSEKGLINKVVEDLFNQIELMKGEKVKPVIEMSHYQLFDGKINDLLEQTNSKTIKVTVENSKAVIKGLSSHSLKNPHDVNSLFQRAEKIKRILLLQWPDSPNYSHTFTSIHLSFPSKKLVSRIQFVELANSEEAVAKHKYAKALSSSFNNLSVALIKHSNLRPILSGKDKLLKYLSVSMEIGTPVLFVCCASPGPDALKHSLPALKFTSKIRECIGAKAPALPEAQSDQHENIEEKSKRPPTGYSPSDDLMIREESNRYLSAKAEDRSLGLYSNQL